MVGNSCNKMCKSLCMYDTQACGCTGGWGCARSWLKNRVVLSGICLFLYGRSHTHAHAPLSGSHAWVRLWVCWSVTDYPLLVEPIFFPLCPLLSGLWFLLPWSLLHPRTRLQFYLTNVMLALCLNLNLPLGSLCIVVPKHNSLFVG